MTVLEDARELIDGMAPATICDDCIAKQRLSVCSGPGEARSAPDSPVATGTRDSLHGWQTAHP